MPVAAGGAPWLVRISITAAEALPAQIAAAVAAHGGTDLGGKLDLPELAGVLAGAAVVVSGNTGPAHLAAAVGTPVVSLFSPVVPAVKWAPFGVPHVLLGDQQAACAGSRARVCPVPGHPCLAGITTTQVVDACLWLAPKLLRRPRSRGRTHVVPSSGRAREAVAP